nr:hypothetical protein [uncultured Sphaerochaeta sp.]
MGREQEQEDERNTAFRSMTQTCLIGSTKNIQMNLKTGINVLVVLGDS